MGFWKDVFDLGKAKRDVEDAAVKLATVETKLYIKLMIAVDASLKEQDLDRIRIERFFIKVPCHFPQTEIPHAIKALQDRAWEVRWAALHTLVRLVAKLGQGDWPLRSQDSVLGPVKDCLDDPDQRVRLKAKDTLKYIKEYYKH